MQILFYILLIFLGFQLCNVLLNVIFSQKIKLQKDKFSAVISVLIPVRNEEHNIANLLSDLQKNKDSNIEILVFDDDSTDNSRNVVLQYMQKDNRIKLVDNRVLKEGWKGKNHACYCLAESAKGEYFLFLDADVRIEPNLINDSVLYAEKNELHLLSIFPKQIKASFGEKVSVPIMHYILLSLLPLIFVRKSPFSAHAAANGQFMLFKASNYLKMQPHALFRNSAVEDIAIARYFKKQNLRIACVTGENRVQCRMYKSYKEALNGFSKNIFMFFGGSRIFAFLFWILAVLSLVFPLLTQNNIYLYLLFWGAIILIQIFYSLQSKQNILHNFILFPLQLIFMLQTMIKSCCNQFNKQEIWKGRNIY